MLLTTKPDQPRDKTRKNWKQSKTLWRKLRV